MTQEEKAKRYDEALEIAKKNYVTAQDLCEGSKIGVECFKNTLENIFPELKGKEDERIREALIALLKFGLEDGSAIAPGFYETKEQALTWLEKQSKHKPKQILVRNVTMLCLIATTFLALKNKPLTRIKLYLIL